MLPGTNAEVSVLIASDAHTWTEERTIAEVNALLPEGWTFNFRYEDGYGEGGFWEAGILDGSAREVWSGSSPAPKILLFTAYGWICLQRTPRATSGIWAPRKDFTLDEVNAEGLRQARVPDPADLDPLEVAAVYRGRPK